MTKAALQRKLGTYRALARLNLMQELKSDLLNIIPEDWEPDQFKDPPARTEARCAHTNSSFINSCVLRCKDCGESRYE